MARVKFYTTDGREVKFTTKGVRARAAARAKRACARKGMREVTFTARGRRVKFCTRR